jgi:hypothetical protein
MTGLTDAGDTAVLRFDSAPSQTGQLTIIGGQTHLAIKTLPLKYRLLPKDAKVLGDPQVQITFADKQSLTIFCDPLSNNCRSEDLITEDGVTFALLWHIDRH